MFWHVSSFLLLSLGGFLLAASAPAQNVESREAEPSADAVPQSSLASARENALFTVLTKVLAAPESRKLLEPVGAETLLLTDVGKSESARLLHALEAPSVKAVSLRLEALKDPLAARLVATVAFWRADPEAFDLLNRLYAQFPDEPGLGLAAASVGLRRSPEVQGAAFRRALKNVKSFGAGFGEENFRVCAVGAGMPDRTLESMEALVECLQRTRPAGVAVSWLRPLEDFLRRTADNGTLSVERMESMLEILVAHQPMEWQGAEPAFSFLPAFGRLVSAGRRGPAARLATALVLRPRGDFESGGPYGGIPAAWRAPVNTEEVSGKSEAWLWIQLAAGQNPAPLAEALDKARTEHPADPQLALSSLLARSLVRPLEERDLAGLTELKPEARDRVLTYASMILPPRLLPGTLCLDAWERQSVRWFETDSCQYWSYGLGCLDRLTENRAHAAVDRVLPVLLRALEKAPFPGLNFSLIADRLRTAGSQENARAWQQILDRWSRGLQDFPSLPGQLADMLHQVTGDPLLWSEPPVLPPGLEERVTALLEVMAGAPRTASPDAISVKSLEACEPAGLARLAAEAACYPRWHHLLARVMAANAQPPERRAALENWDVLNRLLKGLADGTLAPAPRLTLNHQPAGPPVVSWYFEGLRETGQASSPEETDPRKPAVPPLLPWPSLAKTMADPWRLELFLTDAEGKETVLATVDPLPAAGSVSLPGEKLPATGQLRSRVVHRDTPGRTAKVPAMAFTTAPVLLDTAADKLWHLPAPHGLELLGTPVSWRAGASAWLVSGIHRDLPEGLRLVLLDERGQVCAESVLSPSPPPGQPFRSRARVIARTHTMVMRGPLQGYWEDPAVRMAGHPCFLGLALPREAGMDSWFSCTAGRPGMTVQEWNAGSEREPGESGLEIINLWNPVSGDKHSWSVAFSIPESQAVWWRGGQVQVTRLQENQSARPLVLPLEADEEIGKAFWQGKILHFLTRTALRADAIRSPDRCRLITVDSAQLDASASIVDFPEFLRVVEYFKGGRSLPVLLETSRQVPCGILTSKGHLLTVGPEVQGVFAAKKLSTSRLLGPERLLCYMPEKGGTPVLDWSSGSVKLEFLAESPPDGGFPPEFNDLLTAFAKDLVYQPLPKHSDIVPRPVWRLPLRAAETWMLPSGMILAFDEDTAALALLQPLPGNLKPRSP